MSGYEPGRPGRDAIELRIATYNVHRCRGLDRRTLPERIAEVLAGIDADVIALQEIIGAGRAEIGHAQALGAALGMGWVMAPTRLLRSRLYGNAILSRFPIRHHTQFDLSWKTCEPRNAQRAELTVGAHTLHVYNVHLGTALLERRYQAQRLISFVHDRRLVGPKIVLGDFNEWLRGRAMATAILNARLKNIDLYPFLGRRRTYPGIVPLLHLDHIYYEGQVDVRHVEVARSRTALVASDHLPLVADLRVRFP